MVQFLEWSGNDYKGQSNLDEWPYFPPGEDKSDDDDDDDDNDDYLITADTC